MWECNSIETVGFGQGKQNSGKVITKQSFLFVCLFSPGIGTRRKFKSNPETRQVSKTDLHF